MDAIGVTSQDAILIGMRTEKVYFWLTNEVLTVAVVVVVVVVVQHSHQMRPEHGQEQELLLSRQLFYHIALLCRIVVVPCQRNHV